MTTLRVVTLNCWGVPVPDWTGIVLDRKMRMAEIGKALSSSNYDIVALQEIWSEDDYNTISQAVIETFPHQHYFHTGVIGSGLCVFSKHQIVETVTYRYSLNGFPHHLHVGDWFGGKGIGLAQMKVDIEESTVLVNVYVTHIHAEYDRANDPYLAHRIVQSYELSQFIKHTSLGADLVIALGDFNLEPIDLGYDIIRENARLLDTWIEKPNSDADPQCVGNTCERPDCRYGDKKVKKQYPQGKRIDYVMYRGAASLELSLVKSEIHLNQIPEKTDYNFSDHAAVYAEFSIGKNDIVPLVSSSDRLSHRSSTQPYFERAQQIINERNRLVGRDRMFYSGYIFALLFLFFQVIGIELQFPSLAIVAISLRFVLTLMVGFCLWYGVIGLTLERKSLTGCMEGLKKLVK